MKRAANPSVSAKGAQAYGYSEDGRDELLCGWIRRHSPDNGSHALRGQVAEVQEWSRKEELQMTTQPPAPTQVPSGNGGGLVDELTEFRAHFDQIEKLAAHGQQLLTGLAPRMAEVSAMIAEVEAVLHKWNRET